MNFECAHNQYLDPPDDDPVCEDGCGETMKRDLTGAWVCENKFCPLNFSEETVEREMAEMLIGATETVKSLARKIRHQGDTMDDDKTMKAAYSKYAGALSECKTKIRDSWLQGFGAFVLGWQEHNSALETAAQELVAKMRTVYDDPKYRAVWELYASHRTDGPYSGGNWIKEFDALAALLNPFRNGAEKEG